MRHVILLLLLSMILAACGGAAPTPPAAGGAANPLKVLAAETFLADIAQNVAGDRLKVEALLPLGLDPHAFEPTPQDVGKIAQSQALIVNGAGLESWLAKTLEGAGGQRRLIEAAAGLTPVKRTLPGSQSQAAESDPHFWLDPLAVVQYVENIRAGLTAADPAGAATYARNAAAYSAQLKDLDAWIKTQVAQIPPERRLIVTNHESFGYFADRYGFTVIGAVIPSVSSDASPSAQQMARLVDQIRASGATAIFLETGSNPQLADQIARDTGARVIGGLYTHSVTPPGGEAPTYIDMMRYNVQTIVAGLK